MFLLIDNEDRFDPLVGSGMFNFVSSSLRGYGYADDICVICI